MKSAKCTINGETVTVIQNDNEAISIENLEALGCPNVTAGLREIAKVKGIEINPAWNTRRMGLYIINQLTESKTEDVTKEIQSQCSSVGKATELYKRFKESHDKLYSYYKALYNTAKKKKLIEEYGFHDFSYIDTGHQRLNPYHVFIDSEYNLVVDEVVAGIKGGSLETEGEIPEDDRILNLHDIKYYTVLRDEVIPKLEYMFEDVGEETLFEKARTKTGVMVGTRYEATCDEAIFDYEKELLEEKLAASKIISLENHALAAKYPVTAVYVNESYYGFTEEWPYRIDTITKVEGVRIDYRSVEKVFPELLSPQDEINLAFLLESIDNCDAVANDTVVDASDKAEHQESHDYVDLGLPSGVKWATCNIGAKTPGEYGDYFAWGEIEKVNILAEENCNCEEHVNDSLSPSEDAAHVQWGGDWRMPTSKEVQELCYNCKWVEDICDGHKGCRVIGDNGNSIFLPAGGWIFDIKEQGVENVGLKGCYWSSSRDWKYHFRIYLGFDTSSPEDTAALIFPGPFPGGLLIRPVSE